MLTRPVVMTGTLGAAVGVPYAVHNLPEEWPAAIGAQTTAPVEPSATLASSPPPIVPSQGAPNRSLYADPSSLTGMGFYSLDQVLRMDITKEWVYQHWTRKSTGLADPELFGVRVPLVTGTGMSDLAGSLSYYFNSSGQVDRIRFLGTTAETTQLISLAQRHGLQWQTPRVPGEQLLQARSGDKVVSQLRTFPEPVLWSTKPHGSYGVEFEINRPGSGRYVDQTGPKLNVPPPKEIAEAPKADAKAADEQKAESSTVQHAKRSDFRWPG